MNIQDVLYSLIMKRKALIKKVYVESETISVTQNVAKSVDLSVPDQEGYTFFYWINPRGLNISGSFYVTSYLQSQCRVWVVPNVSSSGKIGAMALFIKNEYS